MSLRELQGDSSSVIGKMIDWVILNKNSKILRTSDLQFAYKSRHSTVQCTFMANEVIQYYCNGGGHVYTLLLDASKAFDRVEYVKLFQLLLRKGLCPLTARFIAVLYSSQYAKVRWTDYHSNSFSISNGVKQDGVLSPVLFTIYYDELLIKLQESEIGCHIGNTFIGALSYADDIMLLAPTKASLSKMVSICNEFSKEYKVLFNFNATKSKLIVFGNKSSGGSVTDCTMQLENDAFECVKNDKHLGTKFGNNVQKSQIESTIGDMFYRCNLLLSQFSKVFSSIKYRLFKSFCMSLYGCVLWDFSSTYVEAFYTAWRKCIRRIFSLPYNTHSSFLNLLCNDLPIDSQLHLRFLKFCHQCLISSNSCLRLCSRLAMNGSRSNLCNSLNFICHKYNITKRSLTYLDFLDIAKFVHSSVSNAISHNDLLSVSILADLVNTRDKRDFSFFSFQEVSEIIQFVTTS